MNTAWFVEKVQQSVLQGLLRGEGVAGGLPGAGVLTLPDPASLSKVEPEAESEAEATGFQKAQSCLFSPLSSLCFVR